MAHAEYFYGIDIGGTKIELVACDRGLQVHHRKRVDTPTHDFDAFITAISDLVNEADQLLGTRAAVGLGVPGMADTVTGQYLSSNVPALNGRRLLEPLQARLSRTLVLGNDCQCFALSEAHNGSAQGAPSMFGAILGTGAGGGYCLNGQLVRGANGIAGEWGHCTVSAELLHKYRLPVVDCTCGLQGCLERYISGKGVSLLYQYASGAEASARLSASAIADRYRQGDALAKRVFDMHLDILAQGLANIILTLDPHVIVLGGGLSNLTHLYAELPEAVARHVFKGVRVPPILPPKFGDAGGARGAALLALLHN